MSRVGLKPISLPEKVAVKLDGRTVVVEGPKGKLDFTLPEGISLKTEDGNVVVSRATEQREHRALHGTARSLVNNMILGVSQGLRQGPGNPWRRPSRRRQGQGPRPLARPLPSAAPPDPLRPHRHGERKHQDQGGRHRQTTRRPVRRRSPRLLSAGTLQGQGRPLLR